MMLGDLPPSSSVTRFKFDWAAAVMTRCPICYKIQDFYSAFSISYPVILKHSYLSRSGERYFVNRLERNEWINEGIYNKNL